MIHVFTTNFTDTQVFIDGDDYKHLRNVLRVSTGDDILVSDGSGRDVIASIAEIGSGEIIADIIKERDAKEMPELPVQLVLYQALPKADKMELIIQKCTELGVARIVPVETARCVVKLDSKNRDKKLARWQKIAQSASEQSQRSIVPVIGPVMSWKEAIASMSGAVSVIPYELQEGTTGLWELMDRNLSDIRTINILIGPEGGFAPEEVEAAVAAGIKPISLGRRILRTETAGMALIAALMLKIESECIG